MISQDGLSCWSSSFLSHIFKQNAEFYYILHSICKFGGFNGTWEKGNSDSSVNIYIITAYCGYKMYQYVSGAHTEHYPLFLVTYYVKWPISAADGKKDVNHSQSAEVEETKTVIQPQPYLKLISIKEVTSTWVWRSQAVLSSEVSLITLAWQLGAALLCLVTNLHRFTDQWLLGPIPPRPSFFVFPPVQSQHRFGANAGAEVPQLRAPATHGRQAGGRGITAHQGANEKQYGQGIMHLDLTGHETQSASHFSPQLGFLLPVQAVPTLPIWLKWIWRVARVPPRTHTKSIPKHTVDRLNLRMERETWNVALRCEGYSLSCRVPVCLGEMGTSFRI